MKSFCDELGIASFEYGPADDRYIATNRNDETGELRLLGLHNGLHRGRAAWL